MLTVRTDTEDLARKHRFAIPVARRMGEHLLASPFMQPYERLPPQLRRCQHSTGPHCQQSTNAVGQQSTSADCTNSEILNAVEVRRRLVRTRANSEFLNLKRKPRRTRRGFFLPYRRVMSTLFPITPPSTAPATPPITAPFSLSRLVTAPIAAPAAAPIAASRFVCLITVCFRAGAE